ncbi:hypothetical protein E4U11_006139 [Claviceps purpurea]|nr:hypothetical protein E4U11_006139 [Claviceps purpurea]
MGLCSTELVDGAQSSRPTFPDYIKKMWAELTEQLAVQWQSAEAMHWILGLDGMRKRARFPQTVEPDERAANPHELQPPNLADCEPFDNCWATLMLNRDL